MSFSQRLVQQFKKPKGLWGHLAGWTMVLRPSNRARNKWTVDLLDLEPHHRVLEFGCGPGLALQLCAGKLSKGNVTGIDHSEIMVYQSRRRLAKEVRNGFVDVQKRDLSENNLGQEVYDRVYSLNVIQFLSSMDQAFKNIHQCLVSDGKVATTYQPRMNNSNREKALQMSERIEMSMKKAGFVDIERHELPLKPAPAICIIGRKASA